MKLMYSGLAAVSMMAFMQMDAKRDSIDRDKISGTYISEYFELQHHQEIWLIFEVNYSILCCRTAQRYISTSIGSSLASQNNKEWK